MRARRRRPPLPDAARQSEIREEAIWRLTTKAVQQLLILLSHPDPEIALAAIREVLDRCPQALPRALESGHGQILDIGPPRPLAQPLWPRLPPALTNGRED